MSIFSRIFKIGQASANQVVERFEKPELMLEQAIADKEKQIREVKQSVQQVIATERQTKAQLEKEKAEKFQWEQKAEAAMRSGREDLAVKALERASEHESRAASLEPSWQSQQSSVAELKQEVTEMALMQAPPVLQGLGITVMDGPFFSMMPFPARGLHTLSHVRYTPHLHWKDEPGIDPYQKLASHGRATHVDRMVRDVSRYLPAVRDAKYVDSLFEVKTVLVKNEGDDGRPILFEKHPELPGCYSVLGGKIDNIYDILEKLDAEEFSVGQLQEQSG